MEDCYCGMDTERVRHLKERDRRDLRILTSTECAAKVKERRDILRLNGHKLTVQDSYDAIQYALLDKLHREGHRKVPTLGELRDYLYRDEKEGLLRKATNLDTITTRLHQWLLSQ